MKAGATRQVIQGTAIGAPVGVVAVWFLNTYCLPVPMPAEIGVAFGGAINSAMVWAVQWLPSRDSK